MVGYVWNFLVYKTVNIAWIPCVWDYQSLKSLNPDTLNARPNMASLRETLYFNTHLLLRTIGAFKKYNYRKTFTTSLAHIYARIYSSIVKYTCCARLFIALFEAIVTSVTLFYLSLSRRYFLGIETPWIHIAYGPYGSVKFFLKGLQSDKNF